jgi:sugar/nucleoside kinase (ribokinase family)
MLSWPAVTRVDLLTVGEAFEDLIFLGLDRLPRAGEEVRTSAFVQTIGGGAVITAVAAARLGLPTVLISALGERAEARMAEEGVRAVNLRAADEPPAITASLSTRVNRSFVTFNGVNDHLEPRLFDAVREVSARHVHFAFYPRDCNRWAELAARLRERGVGTSWDFGWNEALLADRGFARLINALDYVFVNEQEAALYTRRMSFGDAVAAWANHPHAAILKLGPKGSRWVGTGQDHAVAATRVKAVDTTGAGDAFNGGFLVARLRGHSAKTALKLGNFVGATSTRAAGGLDGLPRPDEVPEAIRHALAPKS